MRALYQVGDTLSILAAMDRIHSALITGASSGIGAALAQALARLR
jgi:hypothetical protein